MHLSPRFTPGFTPCFTPLRLGAILAFALAGCAATPKTEVTALTAPRSFTGGIEGPAVDRDGNVYAVNFERQQTIGKVTPKGVAEVFVTLPGTSVANGIRFDRAGMMYAVDYVGATVYRIDPATRAIAVHAQNSAMGAPNDLAIAPDGTLYASAPDWKTNTGKVWRIGTDGKVALAAGDMGTTNGIEVSPDGRTLYVNESIQRIIWAFDIGAGGALSGKRRFATFPDFGMDGMRVDVDGNLYVTRFGKGTIAKLARDGRLLAEITLPGKRPSNIAFGGPDGRTAYVTEVENGQLLQFRVDRPGQEWRNRR